MFFIWEASLLPSHGRGIWPRDALKRVSRSLSRVEAGNPQSDNMSETHGWQPVTQPIERDTLNNTTNILPLSKDTKISEDTLPKHQKIWKNYYDNTIEILTSKTQRESLYNKIEHQLENEIFTLPSNISVERLAHSYLMYKEYGVKSSIGSALESSKKLTSVQQQQLINDINIAGEKGQVHRQIH